MSRYAGPDCTTCKKVKKHVFGQGVVVLAKDLDKKIDAQLDLARQDGDENIIIHPSTFLPDNFDPELASVRELQRIKIADKIRQHLDSKGLVYKVDPNNGFYIQIPQE
jgi:glutaredoxin